MANKFYVSGERRAARVCDLFGAIAPRYDLINDLQSLGLHRLWKRKLVRLAHVRSDERALDLCCGTGDVAFALARAGARATGLDFSPPMLRVAGRRGRPVEGAGSPPGIAPAAAVVSFVCGDVLKIPFADASFEVVTISYGLRNLASLETGVNEMFRVARPAARLLVLDFGKPRNRVLRRLYFSYLKLLVPWFGRVLCGDREAYAYIPESLRHYPAQEGVAKTMRLLGCVNVRVFNLFGGVMGINYGEKPAR